MRHSHGLRAALASVNQGYTLGQSLGGGFFVGYISHTANGVATHALIAAPVATGASGTGYTLTTTYAYKTTNTTTTGTTSTFDGSANTDAMKVGNNIANHPAANFCAGLSIGGFNDWYLPARLELEIAYYNLKPTTALNSTGWGINAYSVPPRAANYAASDPLQTSISAFQSGGVQAFQAGGHWSSTQDTATNAWSNSFANGLQISFTKFDTFFRVRAFRKIAV